MIWIALIALSLLYLVLLGIKLWRHLTRLGKDISEVSAKLSTESQSAFSAADPGLYRQELQAGSRAPDDPELLAFPSPAEAAENYQQGKAERRAARIRRRVIRRRRRGQPQSLWDLRNEGVDLTR